MKTRLTSCVLSCALLLSPFANSCAAAPVTQRGLAPVKDKPSASAKNEDLVRPIIPEAVELPDALLSYLGKVMDGAKPIGKKDYDPERYGYLKDNIRWAVKADFDGNGKDDYAIFLNDSKRVLLVAIHSLKKGYEHFELQLDDNLGGLPCGLSLMLQPEGLTQASVAGDIPIDTNFLKNPGFEVNILETGYAMLFYWENGKYHSIYRGC